MSKYKKLTLKDFGVKREERILKNGCRVVLYEKKNSPLFLSVKFLAGARYEHRKKEGLAHFLEHMMAAGTQNFKTKDVLSMYLERLGGSFNLSTNNNFININTEIGDISDVEILMNFLNEIINNPLFDQGSFANEKKSIINEISDFKNSPIKILRNEFLKNFYKNTPMEKTTLGSEESVKNITLKNIVDFYKKNITPQNCTIVASGDIKINNLVKQIERKIKFKNIGQNKINKKNYLLPKKGEKIFVDNLLSQQDLLIVGFRVGSMFNYHPELEIVKSILAGGRASRLVKKLRYEKGLIYSVTASYDTHQDVGGFFVETSAIDEKIREIINIILLEIEDIRKNGITEEELCFAKDKIHKSTKKNFQTSEDWVRINQNRDSLWRNGKTRMDFINKITKVSNKDIIKIMNKYFSKEKIFIGLYSKGKNYF